MSEDWNAPDQLSSDLASLQINRSSTTTRSSSSGGGSGVWLRVLIGLVVAAGVIGLGVVGWPYLEARLFKTEVSIGEVLSVSPAQSQTTLTAAGFVVARTLSKVSCTTSGRVAVVHVVEGQHVDRGDVLIELDASDQASAVASAQARVASAQARAAQARATLAETEQQLVRNRRLVEAGAANRATVEDAEARVSVLRSAVSVSLAEVRAAQAEVHALEVNEAKLTILAPISGTVITKPVELGEIVTPQTEVLQLADFSSLVVEIDVPEGRLGLIRIDGPAQIVLDAFPERRLRGTTYEIASRVNRTRASVPVRVRFAEPAEGVLPDMSAHVSFLNEALSEEQLRAHARTVVPARAVVSRNGRDVVFTITDGLVHERALSLGESTPDGRVVLDGAEAGTHVVLDPPATLAEGQSVREREL